MSNTAPSRADPVVVFPLGWWCPPQETSQPHPPPMYPEKKRGSHKMARPQQNWGLLTLLTRWANIWTMPNTASPKSEPPCGRAVYTPVRATILGHSPQKTAPGGYRYRETTKLQLSNKEDDVYMDRKCLLSVIFFLLTYHSTEWASHCIYSISCKIWFCCVSFLFGYVKSMWHSDGTSWYKPRSTSPQVMPCCLIVPSHYVNHQWTIQWKSPECKFGEISHP